MDKIRTVVVGAGYFAQAEHLPAMKANADIEITAICRRNLEALKPVAAAFDIPGVYTDYREMIDREKPDAVMVITSVAATLEVSSYAMEKGIPTMLEKPPGRNVAEARALVEVARRTGTINVLAFNRRHALPVVRARKLIQDEGLPIRSVYCTMLRYRRFDKAFVMGTGVHGIDTMRYLAGEVKEVTTVEAPSSAQEGGANLYSILQFESGAVGCLSLHTVVGVSDERYEIHTEDRSLFLKVPQGGFATKDGGFTYWHGPIYPLKSSDSDMITPYLKPRMLTGIYEESAELVRCIRENTHSPNNVEDGLKTMLLAEAIAKGGHQKVEKA